MRDPRIRVDLDRLHLREVDHETVVEHAVAGRVVPTSTDSDLKLIRVRESEGGLDITGAETAGDHRRTAVDERVEAPPRGVVAGVLRKDDLACQRQLQLVDVHVGHRKTTPVTESDSESIALRTASVYVATAEQQAAIRTKAAVYATKTSDA